VRGRPGAGSPEGRGGRRCGPAAEAAPVGCPSQSCPLPWPGLSCGQRRPRPRHQAGLRAEARGVRGGCVFAAFPASPPAPGPAFPGLPGQGSGPDSQHRPPRGNVLRPSCQRGGCCSPPAPGERAEAARKKNQTCEEEKYLQIGKGVLL